MRAIRKATVSAHYQKSAAIRAGGYVQGDTCRRIRAGGYIQEDTWADTCRWIIAGGYLGGYVQADT